MRSESGLRWSRRSCRRCSSSGSATVNRRSYRRTSAAIAWRALTQWIVPLTLRSAPGMPWRVSGSSVQRTSRDRAVGVLDDLLARDDADAAQAHFAAGHETMEALRRHFHEIVALDPQLARERHRARAERFVLRMVRRTSSVSSCAVVEVRDHELQRIDHGHAPRRVGVEFLAHAAFEHANSITRILLGDADALPERADRRRRKAAAAHAGQASACADRPSRRRGRPARAPSACACSSPCS